MSHEETSDFVGDIQLLTAEDEEREKCQFHTGQSFTASCSQCDQLVCLKCIVSTHKGHTFEDLGDLIEVSNKMIVKIKAENIEKRMAVLMKESESAEKGVKKIQGLNNLTEAEIQGEYLSCMERIDKDRDQLIMTLEADLKRAEERQKKVLEKLSGVRKDLQTTENVQKDGNTVQIIQLCRKLQSKYEENVQGPLEENKVIARKSKFLAHDKHSNVLGECPIVPEFELYGVYQISLATISTLKNLLEDETWVAGVQSPLTLRLHVPHSKNKSAIKYKVNKGFVYSLAFTKENTVVLMTFVSIHEIRAYDLQHVDDKGVVFVDTRKLFPLGLEVSQNGDVYACASERYSKDMSANTERGILRISKTGQVLNFFQFEEVVGNFIFHYPSCLTENIDGSLCVIDRHSHFSGRVVALNTFGKKIFTYERPPSVSAKEEMDLKYITRDKFGNLLISDCINNRVHLISKSGMFISLILCPDEEISVQRPEALHVDKFDNLWIGCRSQNPNTLTCQVMKIRMNY
ncbi:E3 ubiquitin-protein ligase TRIM45-like [Saccostrea cucullata]|uniref:E3 ubiquitin-protein ligase TRIM45-like n=1 Tax=Saccostrea cuccullata TaxID=36930 RepID=UPI002ED2E905